MITSNAYFGVSAFVEMDMEQKVSGNIYASYYNIYDYTTLEVVKTKSTTHYFRVKFKTNANA